MLPVNFNPFPTLHTERLTLRQLVDSDKNEFFTFRSNADIMRYIPRPLTQTVDEAAQLITSINDGISRNDSITWAITLTDSPVLIGTIGYVRMAKEHYRAEVGYLLSPAYRGSGIMHEALQAVIAYGFERMKLHSIEAIIAPENTASANVLERAGFVKEAHFRENQFYGGQFRDTVHYALLTPFN